MNKMSFFFGKIIFSISNMHLELKNFEPFMIIPVKLYMIFYFTYYISYIVIEVN